MKWLVGESKRALRGDSLWEVETARELAKSARQHLTAPTVRSRNMGNQRKDRGAGFYSIGVYMLHVPTTFTVLRC